MKLARYPHPKRPCISRVLARDQLHWQRCCIICPRCLDRPPSLGVAVFCRFTSTWQDLKITGPGSFVYNLLFGLPASSGRYCCFPRRRIVGCIFPPFSRGAFHHHCLTISPLGFVPAVVRRTRSPNALAVPPGVCFAPITYFAPLRFPKCPCNPLKSPSLCMKRQDNEVKVKSKGMNLLLYIHKNKGIFILFKCSFLLNDTQ